MIIETKYNVNDKVFTVYSDKVIKTTINGIMFIKGNNMCYWENTLKYNLQLEGGGNIDREESAIFKTKEELLKAL